MPIFSLPVLVTDGASKDLLGLPKAARIALAPLGGADAFLTALEGEVPSGCIVATRLDRHVRDLLDCLLLAVPDGHFLLGLADAGPVRGVPRIVGDRIVTVAPLPDAEGMEWAAWQVWFEGQAARLMRRVEAGEFHWLVAQAFRRVLVERLPGGHPEPDECDVVRSLKDLCVRCGAKPDAFQHRRQEAGVDLGRFIGLWRATLIVRERLLGDRWRRTSWPTVARRAGYAGSPGIRYLLTRTLDTTLDGVDLGDLPRLFQLLEQIIAGDE